MRKEVKEKAQSKRNKNKWKCRKCRKLFEKVYIDHIKPVVNPSVGFPKTEAGEDDWNEYICNMFCGAENLQVLCKKCHDAKTQRERKARKK